MTAAELAGALGLQPEKLEILLYSLVRAELLTVDAGRFANTPEANAFLVRGRAGYLGSSHELYADLWTNLLKLAGSIRANAPLGKHDFDKMSDAELGAFLRGLHAGALATGAQLAKQYRFERAAALLDVGGGAGGVAIAACQACPGLSATIVELPRVVPFAAASVAEANLSGRIRTAAVDVTATPPDGIFDVAVLRFFIQVLGKGRCPASAGKHRKGPSLRRTAYYRRAHFGKQSPVAATYPRPKPRDAYYLRVRAGVHRVRIPRLADSGRVLRHSRAVRCRPLRGKLHVRTQGLASSS